MNIGKIKSQIIKKIKGSPVLYHFAVNVHTRYDKLFKKNKVIRSAVLLTKHQKQKEYSLMSISDYCIKHNIPKNVIDPTTNRTVYIPEVYGGEPCKELEYTYPVVYWTMIHGLTAVSESSSVIIGNKLLNDKVLLEYFSKINIDNHMFNLCKALHKLNYAERNKM